MASNVEIPGLGESVTQAILVKWIKSDGSVVRKDEPLCELETDKANVDLPAPIAGVIRHMHKEGDTVAVGEVIARIEESQAASAASQPAAAPKPAGAAIAPSGSAAKAAPVTSGGPVASKNVASDDLSPAVRRLVEENKLDPASIAATGPGGRITKDDVLAHLENQVRGSGNRTTPHNGPASAATSSSQNASPPTAAPPAENHTPAPRGAGARESLQPGPTDPPRDFDARGERRVMMSKLRQRIASRLVEAQHTAAILTTFNEVDMSGILELRAKYKERFNEVHGIGLGFMSFFSRACLMALREFPRLNAYLEGSEVVYHNYVHLGIAVSTDRGLAVPVLRNVETMSFARIESEIKRLATATRDGKLGVDELSGGTFTITNGGIYGSLNSTPIINPPQSGILGMHAIQKRAVVINDKIEIRPMMNLALSYDHRLVDGKESVSFLVRVKQSLEDPARLMLEI